MLERSRDQLVVALLFVGRHLLDQAAAQIKANGKVLSSADISVLLVLTAFPGSSQTEVASFLGRDKTTLSRTVARLEEWGIVNTRIDPVDGRRKTLELSEDAQSIATPVLNSIMDRILQISSSMTSDEKEGGFRFIDMLIDDLLVVKNN